jgi:threonyl-tRNA synthetase
LNREWQLATIQLDVNQPERFDLTYTNSAGQEERPVMIHVAVMGSVERFMGVLIEHFAGKFPVWLAPVQVQLVSVGADHVEYCRQLQRHWQAQGLRVAVDDASETIGNKIRKASKQHIPYSVVIGDKEVAGGQLAVRFRGQKDNQVFSMGDFVTYVSAKNSTRAIEL